MLKNWECICCLFDYFGVGFVVVVCCFVYCFGGIWWLIRIIRRVGNLLKRLRRLFMIFLMCFMRLVLRRSIGVILILMSRSCGVFEFGCCAGVCCGIVSWSFWL